MKAALAALFVAAAGWALPGGMSSGRAPPPVNDAAIMADAMPRTLSAFGFFRDDAARVPNERVHPYTLNMPLFSDYAEKRRFVYLPPGNVAQTSGDGPIDFPVGAALIKSFGYPRDGALKLIETRVLLRRADGWVALPYVWNAAQTEAVLKIAGKRVPVAFTDPSGTRREISYAVPNVNQCKECHSDGDRLVPIGPKARNMGAGGQLERLAKLGAIDRAPVVAHPLPDWDRPSDGTVATRARGYLDVNCAHCHNRTGSASNSGLFLGWDEPAGANLGLYKRPVAAGRGSGGFSFAIDPGKAETSILMHRLRSLEPGVAMPEVGRAVVHEEGADLLARWIAGLPVKPES